MPLPPTSPRRTAPPAPCAPGEPELLAYFDGRLTNGPTEGTNRITEAVKRQGFGYTNAPSLPAENRSASEPKSL